MLKKTQTLLERVGGEQVIGQLIHEFYDRVIAAPELGNDSSGVAGGLIGNQLTVFTAINRQ